MEKIEMEGNPIDEHELILSQDVLRKRDAKFETKRPKMSKSGGTFTEFTRLSERQDLTDEKVDKLIKENQELK
jgi:hypothetical protein